MISNSLDLKLWCVHVLTVCTCIVYSKQIIPSLMTFSGTFNLFVYMQFLAAKSLCYLTSVRIPSHSQSEHTLGSDVYKSSQTVDSAISQNNYGTTIIV